MDPYILLARAEEAERRVSDLEYQLSAARASAMHYEHECKTIRKELQRVRMGTDTERISRKDV